MTRDGDRDVAFLEAAVLFVVVVGKRGGWANAGIDINALITAHAKAARMPDRLLNESMIKAPPWEETNVLMREPEGYASGVQYPR